MTEIFLESFDDKEAAWDAAGEYASLLRAQGRTDDYGVRVKPAHQRADDETWWVCLVPATP